MSGGRAERARKKDARNARGREVTQNAREMKMCGTRAESAGQISGVPKRRPRRRVTVESPGGKRWPTAAPGLCPPPARDRTQRRDYATAGPARTGIPAAERHIIPQLSHVEQINCYVASDMASQPNSLSENVRRLCRRGDWRTEQRWRLSCRHRSGVSRFGATGQKPVDGWTAATRLTASPEARQQQPKRSTHLVRKPVSSKCSRHAWPCHS